MGMSDSDSTLFLLASADPELLTTVEPLLRAGEANLRVVLSSEALPSAIAQSDVPDLILIDAALPGAPIAQALAAARADAKTARVPILLVADSVTREWADLLHAGAIDDVILRSAEPAYWQLRIDRLLRSRRMEVEVESLREAALQSAQVDRLTGVYNRETMLNMLFRETDRMQRANSSLTLVLFDIDDFGHWNSRLGSESCDDLLCQVARRTGSLLRSYDLLGRLGQDEFLVALPSCALACAMTLTERLRTEVFAVPFHVSGEAIRLSACYGIAASQGRSPVVVLREAEKALDWARAAGPETIQCFGRAPNPEPPPVSLFSSASGDELLAW
jgi:two-component system, cell cycle response regulator